MTRKNVIGTRLLKCPKCHKWVQYVSMYFKTKRIKALVSTCKHDDVRIIGTNIHEFRTPQELAPQDEYLLLNKELKCANQKS